MTDGQIVESNTWDQPLGACVSTSVARSSRSMNTGFATKYPSLLPGERVCTFKVLDTDNAAYEYAPELTNLAECIKPDDSSLEVVLEE